MKHTSLALAVSIVFFFSTPHDGKALPDLPQALIDSTVLLTAEHGRCGSGFIAAEGYLITNAHVVRSLCPSLICHNVSLRSASAVGQPPTRLLPIESIRVIRLHSALDIAVLKTEPPLSGTLSTGSLTTGQKRIFSLGFPRCEVLELSEGEISGSDPIRLFTTTKGAHGSSGSPIFDTQFQLVGVVHQAGSMLGGLGSLVFHRAFQNKAVRAGALQSVLHRTPAEGWNESAALLLTLLTEVAPNLGRVERLRMDLDVVSATRGLIDDALFAQIDLSEIAPLLFLDHGLLHLAALAPAAIPSSRRELAERYFVAYQLETRGLFTEHLAKIDHSMLSEILQTTPHSSDQVAALEQLISDFSSRDYPGLQIALLSLALPLLAVAVVILITWAFTVGIVYARVRGGLLRRLIISVIVAVFFWPISFIVFLVAERRNALPSRLPRSAAD